MRTNVFFLLTSSFLCFVTGVLLMKQSMNLLVMANDANMSGIFLGLGGVPELFPLISCVSMACMLNLQNLQPQFLGREAVINIMLFLLAGFLGCCFGFAGGLWVGLTDTHLLWPRFAQFALGSVGLRVILMALAKAMSFGLVFTLATQFEKKSSLINKVLRPMLAGGGTHLLITYFLY